MPAGLPTAPPRVKKPKPAKQLEPDAVIHAPPELKTNGSRRKIGGIAGAGVGVGAGSGKGLLGGKLGSQKGSFAWNKLRMKVKEEQQRGRFGAAMFKARNFFGGFLKRNSGAPKRRYFFGKKKN